MDLTATIAPRSDQLNAEDMLSGPRTVTVESVTAGSAEQPVNINLVEFPGRPFRPSKTVRRILVAAWGAEASAYAGRRMTIYRDADVRFGGQNVGGIRVSHLSHLDKRLTLALTVTRGKRAPYVVEPLPEVQKSVAVDMESLMDAAAKLDSPEALLELWNANVANLTEDQGAELKEFIRARKDQLAAEAAA